MILSAKFGLTSSPGRGLSSFETINVGLEFLLKPVISAKHPCCEESRGKKRKQSKGAGMPNRQACALHVAFILDTVSKTRVSFSFAIISCTFSLTLTPFLETLPTLNYLNITKFRGEDILLSKNSSCPCKHSYIFTASQSEIFSRSKVLLLIQSSLKYQKEYHWNRGSQEASNQSLDMEFGRLLN